MKVYIKFDYFKFCSSFYENTYYFFINITIILVTLTIKLCYANAFVKTL